MFADIIACITSVSDKIISLNFLFTSLLIILLTIHTFQGDLMVWLLKIENVSSKFLLIVIVDWTTESTIATLLDQIINDDIRLQELLLACTFAKTSKPLHIYRIKIFYYYTTKQKYYRVTLEDSHKNNCEEK